MMSIFSTKCMVISIVFMIKMKGAKKWLTRPTPSYLQTNGDCNYLWRLRFALFLQNTFKINHHNVNQNDLIHTHLKANNVDVDWKSDLAPDSCRWMKFHIYLVTFWLLFATPLILMFLQVYAMAPGHASSRFKWFISTSQSDKWNQVCWSTIFQNPCSTITKASWLIRSFSKTLQSLF